MKDNSVSIWAERALRLVDPKRVRTGGDDALGETQIPGSVHVSATHHEEVRLLPLAWYVQPSLSHSVS